MIHLPDLNSDTFWLELAIWTFVVHRHYTEFCVDNDFTNTRARTMARFLLAAVAVLGLASDIFAQGGSAGSFGSYGSSGSAAIQGYGAYGCSGSAAAGGGGRLGLFGRIAARREARLAARSAPVSAAIMQVAVPMQACAPAMVPVATSYNAPMMMQDCPNGNCPLMQSAQQTPQQAFKSFAARQTCNCSCPDCTCDRPQVTVPQLRKSPPTMTGLDSSKLIAVVPEKLLTELPASLLLDMPKESVRLASTGLVW